VILPLLFFSIVLSHIQEHDPAAFCVLRTLGTDIHLIQYQISPKGKAIQSTDTVVIHIDRLRSAGQVLKSAQLSPQQRWLAIETGLKVYPLPPLPGSLHSLTIIDMQSRSVVFQKQDDQLDYFYYEWPDENHLWIQSQLGLNTEAHNALYTVREFSAPQWTNPPKVAAPPSQDHTTLFRMIEEQRTPQEQQRAAQHQAYIRQGAEYLALTHYGYPGYVQVFDNRNYWVDFLQGSSGAVSEDGLEMACRVNKEGRLKLIYFRRKVGDYLWKEEEVPESRRLWKVQFWNQWLVLGARNKDESRAVRFVDRNNFKRSFEVQGDLLPSGRIAY
jgi:hypothetical protein